MHILPFDPTVKHLMLTWLGYIQRHDGAQIYFTTAETAITIESITYRPMPGIQISDMREVIGGDEQSVQIDFWHSANPGLTLIETIDLYNGVYDGARLSLWLIDRNQLPVTLGPRFFIAKIMPIKVSAFGHASFDIRSLKEQNITKTQVYQPTCRTDLFFELCGLLRDAWAVSGTVVSVIDTYNITVGGFTPFVDGYFDHGYGVTVPDNTDFEIIKYTGSTQTLTLALPRAVTGLIQAGNSIIIYPGCDKSFGSGGCGKFSNWANFQGEPHSAGYAAAVA